MLSEEADPPPHSQPSKQGLRTSLDPLKPKLLRYDASWRKWTTEELFASLVLRIPSWSWMKLLLQLSSLSTHLYTLTRAFLHPQNMSQPSKYLKRKSLMQLAPSPMGLQMVQMVFVHST